ncbi:MAG: imidazole glycerol phosphate synthase subunit HisH [Solirubrobacteraceae bacterium]
MSGQDRAHPGPTIAVVDYGMGNRRSVQKALEHVGARALITRDHDELRAAAGIVIPGVGAFPHAMSSLRSLGLDEVLVQRADSGTPLLGICLGMQLLFERSVEVEPATGLGLIAGEVAPLQTRGLRLPHIGWNEVTFERPSDITRSLPDSGRPFYHVHSLAPRPADPSTVVGTTEYGERFATIVAQERVFGVQFHPEKSSTDGLAMLADFAAVSAGAGAGAARGASVTA